MYSPNNDAANEFGLLAYGSSGHWAVSIDESLVRENQRSVEIEGPNVYLVFALPDVAAISNTIAYLQQRLDAHGQSGSQNSEPKEKPVLGGFDHSTVSMVWDTEHTLRCFLVIGGEGLSTLRLTLQEEDARMLLAALQQAAEDIAGTSIAPADPKKE